MPCHLSSRPSLAASFFFLFVKISFSSRRTALESDPINLGAGMPLLRPDCWSVGVAVTVRDFFFFCLGEGGTDGTHGNDRTLFCFALGRDGSFANTVGC